MQKPEEEERHLSFVFSLRHSSLTWEFFMLFLSVVVSKSVFDLPKVKLCLPFLMFCIESLLNISQQNRIITPDMTSCIRLSIGPDFVTHSTNTKVSRWRHHHHPEVRRWKRNSGLPWKDVCSSVPGFSIMCFRESSLSSTISSQSYWENVLSILDIYCDKSALSKLRSSIDKQRHALQSASERLIQLRRCIDTLLIIILPLEYLRLPFIRTWRDVKIIVRVNRLSVIYRRVLSLSESLGSTEPRDRV